VTRVSLDVVADMLENVATPPPWRVSDENHSRHVVDVDGNAIALDVGDDAPLIAAAPDLAADLIDAHVADHRRAVAHVEERERETAATRAIAMLAHTLGCESETPEEIVREALDHCDDAVGRSERAEQERDAAVASHAALAAAVREYLGAVDTERECDRRRLAREPELRDASGAIVRYQALGTVQRETRAVLDVALAAAGGGR
jgi:hypothetical protein